VPNDADLLDPISGNAWVNGIGVEVTPVASVAPAAAGATAGPAGDPGH
jgi:hypothetical protein